MEEIKKFIQLLWRYRLVILVVPLITVMITFYIVRNLPDSYPAEAQLATGIVDETQQMSLPDVAILQESKIAQKFINMTETMKSKSMIDLVSYKLILHDLTSPVPFRPPSEKMRNLTPEQRKKAIQVITQKYNDKEGGGLNLRDSYEKSLFDLIAEMRYNEWPIKQELFVYRVGETDFIYVDFESESPELSAFVVNTLAEEFTADYTKLLKQSQRFSVEFLKNLIQAKADSLNGKVIELRDYRIANKILALNEQSSHLLQDISNYKTQKQETEKNIESYRKTIENIDRKFDPKDREYVESVVTSKNQDILAVNQQIKNLIDKQIDNDLDEDFRAAIDSLKKVQTAQIYDVNDSYVTNPLNSKQALISRKLDLQVSYDLAVYSLSSIDKKINELNNSFSSLVPHEAVIQTYERDIEIAQQEYQDLLTQYNQLSMESEFPVKLRILQRAMPGLPMPSKKMLLVILSGMASGTFCIVVFFVIFFLDNKVRRPGELATLTKIPVLGYLNLVGKSTLDLKGIWKNLHGTPEMLEFKKQLRSTRFEVNRELETTTSRGQMLSITSLSEGEGKTLIAACIAYTYVMINKKVLLIDGNFDNPSITRNSNTQLFVEDYLKTGYIDGDDFNSGIIVMGNHGGDKSLLEVCDEKTIRQRFDKLRSQFDVILIEAPALDDLNKPKEWISLTDKTLCVFEANQSLNETKKQHIHYLTTINGKFIGWILNKVRAEGKSPEKIDQAIVIEE
jgi:succinoglycan biosynthesis transport protein ExoP